MKYSKKYMNLEKGLKTEWIITNGLGGYAASSIIGANTRKYHGLLVAPLTPPARRFLVLSKLDESIEIVNKKYNIYTNIGKDYVTDGYKYQKYFEKSEIPVYYYEIEDVKIKKSICMQYGKNTVIVQYNIKNGEYNSKLTLAPVVNFRDFHTTNTNHNFKLKQNNVNTKLKLIIDKYNEFPIYMKVSEGKYIKHYDDIFKNMFYIEEEKRGFCAEEDHIVPGRYEIEIKPNEQKDITFICSLEENIDELDGKEVIKKEKNRIKSLIKNSELVQDGIDEDLIKTYIIASDNFVVYRPSFGLHTIIAGYPWFLDWGRDTLISFEGLLLISKRFDIAKEVLLTMIRDVKYGLVPNGYSGFDNRPLYNSVDSSLLLFEQVKKYLEYTKDEAFIKDNLYDILVKIIYSYIDGIDIDGNNIYMDKDYLIVSGTQNTQNTWMDAKVDGVAITPRNGKAVEVNSLWYNALKIMEEITAKFYGIKYAKQYGNLAKECKKSFESKFYQKRRKCLYDVLGDSKIRPNQLFALGLSYPILDCSTEEAKNCFETVTKKLLNLYGLKTLSKGEENYTEIYEGDSFKRDSSYHQGITWPWLLGIYNDAFRNIIKYEKSKIKKKELEVRHSKFVNDVKETFTKELKEGKTVGSISELYDSKKPFEAKGAFAQGWSVAEVFRIILKD
ncbi:MAG TPA: glycogen debranching enzyme N-terminal domain-containing protein [Clostridiaceae bacterium]|nr:glycogen debranching enzyme N-terminal domain-containing protein [Clostridiaceae bacterium]